MDGWMLERILGVYSAYHQTYLFRKKSVAIFTLHDKPQGSHLCSVQNIFSTNFVPFLLSSPLSLYTLI